MRIIVIVENSTEEEKEKLNSITNEFMQTLATLFQKCVIKKKYGKLTDNYDRMVYELYDETQ